MHLHPAVIAAHHHLHPAVAVEVVHTDRSNGAALLVVLDLPDMSVLSIREYLHQAELSRGQAVDQRGGRLHPRRIRVDLHECHRSNRSISWDLKE